MDVAKSQQMWVSLEAWEGEKWILPSESPERKKLCQHFDFSPVRPAEL